MELIRHEIPFASKGYLALLAQIFGQEEADLEEIQVNGSELMYNRDIAFTVEEQGEVYGTSHITFPRGDGSMAGLSGLCTSPKIRGTGMGKKLFGALVEEADAAGAEVSFLGTNNRMAAEMYASFGYAYLPGTYVMARFRGTNRNLWLKRYEQEPASVEVRKLDAGLRIPVIPLLVQEGPGFLLDSNAGVFNNRQVTQVSTMGLFPKYLQIMTEGGEAFWLRSEEGLCGGLATVKREAGRETADFFACRGFLEESGKLVEAVRENCPEAVFGIAEADTEKQQLLAKAGFRKKACEKRFYGNLQVETGIWEHRLF